ncbi:MAG: glycosyltransferase family 39 protein [Blastocatellia bacterium]|nr:glycosyltransferase family 39 protein [Blastocatellia bacterium]
MDDVDAVQAQISRTMLATGDWVTPHLNGIAYFEKPPFKYWMIATSFSIFGVSDWAARLPIMLGVIALCWITFRFGAWAFSERAGLFAGLVLSTSIGLFLFTRILIADSLVTLTVALALWAFLRALEEPEKGSRRWMVLVSVSVGIGVLLKGLIAAVFPAGVMFVYLVVTGELFRRATWKKLYPVTGLAVFLLVAAPWHVVATLRNPPFFDFSMTSTPGHYRGFFWFFFFNEHLLRFLGRRHPRDYNTVPRLWFWLLHLVWFFPWSAFFPSWAKLSWTRTPATRAERARLLALCWIGFVMFFFTFSTTQEYYSMPMYPAVALLLGCGMAADTKLNRVATGLIAGVAGLAALAIGIILFQVKDIAAVGDISSALRKSSDVYNVYTLSLGHMGDLTLASFAYLRFPLVLAGIAFVVGFAGAVRRWKSFDMQAVTAAAMMVLLFLAARSAMVTFEPYLGSRLLAESLRQAPPGTVIVDNQFYTFSSVFFYADVKQALLLNGRINNLEYGSYAPGAPNVFIDDNRFEEIWKSPQRSYLLIEDSALKRLETRLGRSAFHPVRESGGKWLFCNQS